MERDNPGPGQPVFDLPSENIVSAWLLRQRNYWKLIWAVKAIIWNLWNNWQTGENHPWWGGARVPAIITSSCKDHLQKNICLLNEMQLDGSFILSQSSELIEKGFSNECIWFHSSYWAFYIFFTKKRNHLHVFPMFDDVLDERTVVCSFCQIIPSHHSKDWIEQKFSLI